MPLAMLLVSAPAYQVFSGTGGSHGIALRVFKQLDCKHVCFGAPLS